MTSMTESSRPRWKSPCYCSNLRRAAKRISEYYDRHLTPFGLSISQYSILANLSGMDGCGTGELARRLQLEKSTLVRTLQPLLQNGLVEDRAPAGSRARQLHLTAMGKERLEAARPAWKSAQTAMKDRFGDRLTGMMDLLNEMDE